MHRQTIDSILPLLSLLQQPAFCVRSNGTLAFNRSAEPLVPDCAASLARWLGPCKAIYDMWDRTSNLQFSLTVCSTQYSVLLQALQDGTLFLLTPCTAANSVADTFGVVSQTIRQPLSDLSSLFQLSNAGDETKNAAACRHLLRITRIVSNLSELTRLSQENPTVQLASTDTAQLLDAFLDEVEDLCLRAGRKLIRNTPKKPIRFYADEALLKRALLNLISNALKFSTADTPILFRVEIIGTHLVLQVENFCSDGGSELLRAAFSRLTRRPMLPDPGWGVGLGLPLANTIARLHGGMVAVETNNGKATVSLSVSLQRPERAPKLASVHTDYTGGVRQALLELSDVLPGDVYKK